MLAKNMESVAQCLDSFFDPRKPKTKHTVPISIKRKYLLFILQEHWAEICGQDLAINCYPEKFVNSILYISARSSMLANELFMMQGFFLKKINDFLAERMVVKKLSFHVGGNIPVVKNIKLEEAELEDKRAWKDRLVKLCPGCGALITAEEESCQVCARRFKDELEAKLAELLKIEPWLTYEQSLQYYTTDKITYLKVKSRLQNYYYEKIRNQNNTAVDAFIAVQLLTGKLPEEINDELVNNVISYLRRKKYVPASGS